MMIIIYEAMTRDDDDRTREDRATQPKKAEFRNNFQLTWSSPPEMFRFFLYVFYFFSIVQLTWFYSKKHRKNCECCPVSQLIVR